MHKLATQDDEQADRLLILYNYELPTQRVTNGREFVTFGFLHPIVNESRLSKGGGPSQDFAWGYHKTTPSIHLALILEKDLRDKEV